jgi:hypothetical protein
VSQRWVVRMFSWSGVFSSFLLGQERADWCRVYLCSARALRSDIDCVEASWELSDKSTGDGAIGDEMLLFSFSFFFFPLSFNERL